MKSDVFEVEYDSILSLDYPQIFRKDVKKDSDDLLRGTGFSIAGFYFRTTEEGLFGKEVDETAFANNTSLPNPTSEVYVKWVGNTETKYQLKVVLGKTDDVILGRFGLLDAIESVSLQSWGDQGTEFNKSATLQEENGKVIVDFKTPQEKRAYVQEELDSLREESLRLTNAQTISISLSPKLEVLKDRLLAEHNKGKRIEQNTEVFNLDELF